MTATGLDLHRGRATRCRAQPPPTLDAMFRDAAAADRSLEAPADRSMTLTYYRMNGEAGAQVSAARGIAERGIARVDGAHLAGLAIRLKDGLGEITADGTSIVEPPSRAAP